MKLYVDIGNTKTTIYYEQKSIIQVALIDTIKSEDMLLEFSKIIEQLNPAMVTICSVVPEVNSLLMSYLSAQNINAKILQPEHYGQLLDFGKLDYMKMGADRVVVDYATVKKYGKNVIVFDLGTAMTVDVIVNGQYKSGYIYPGLRLIRESLVGGASQLNTFEFKHLTANSEAVDTYSQLNDGILLGLIGTINQYIKISKKHFPEDFKIVLTGGSMFNLEKLISIEEAKSLIDAEYIVDTQLMCTGLMSIAEII